MSERSLRSRAGHRFRISVRRLLVAVMLVAVVLAWFVNRSNSRRGAIEAVRSVGGVVIYQSALGVPPVTAGGWSRVRVWFER
jgi:hypothetical protein